MSLSKIARRVLHPDLHAMVEAGFLTEDLQTTKEGRLALIHILLEANQAAVVEEAKRVIADRKEAEAKN